MTEQQATEMLDHLLMLNQQMHAATWLLDGVARTTAWAVGAIWGNLFVRALYQKNIIT